MDVFPFLFIIWADLFFYMMVANNAEQIAYLNTINKTLESLYGIEKVRSQH